MRNCVYRIFFNGIYSSEIKVARTLTNALQFAGVRAFGELNACSLHPPDHTFSLVCITYLGMCTEQAGVGDFVGLNACSLHPLEHTFSLVCITHLGMCTEQAGVGDFVALTACSLHPPEHTSSLVCITYLGMCTEQAGVGDSAANKMSCNESTEAQHAIQSRMEMNHWRPNATN